MFLRFAALAGLSLLSGLPVNAQLISGDIFLKGNYVEIGIAGNGAYGSGGDAPSGYHPRVDAGTTGLSLGFVADPDKDGWTVGSPDYIGDYFVPGAPQEGWDIQVNGTRAYAWRSSSTPLSFTGGPGSNVSYSSSGSNRIGVWQGSMGNLSIRQTTTLQVDKLYFIVNVVLKNTGTTTLSNIYYNRTVDPDNEVALTTRYETINSVVNRIPNKDNKVLVKSIGSVFKSYLGLGTKDCRAKPYVISTGLIPSASLDEIYDGTAMYKYTPGIVDTSDVGIGIVYNIGNLAAGDSTTLAYAYILKEADLDSAFQKVNLAWRYNSTNYNSGDTIRACKGSVVNVNIVNGSYYNWGVWTPSTGLSLPSGSGNSITVGSSPVTYRVIGSTTVCGDNDTMLLTVAPVNLAMPGISSPVSYCTGATASPLGATGINLKWYTLAVGGTASTTAPVPSTAVAGSTTYYVTQSDALGCESDRAAIVVNVYNTPSAPVVTSPINYCKGDIATALTATGTGLKWYTTPAGGTGSTTAPVPSTAVAGTFTYYVVQAAGSCESPRSAIVVNVNPNDKPGVTTPVNYCVGNTASALSATGVNLKWYTTSTGGTFTTTAPTPSTASIGTTTYYVTQTTGGCESQRQEIVVSINPPPTVTIATTSPSGSFVYCKDDSIVLKAVTPFGAYFQWQRNGVDMPGATSDSVKAYDNATYTIIVTNGPDCSASASVTPSLDTIEAPSLSPDDLLFCLGTRVMLYCSPALAGSSYSWIKDGSTFTAPDAPSVPISAAGTYSAKVTDKYGCPTQTNAITAGTYPAIEKPTILRFDPLIRLNKFYASYQWYRNNKAISGANAISYTLLYDGTYYAKVSDVNGCVNYSDTIVIKNLAVEDVVNDRLVTVYPNPASDYVTIDAPVAVMVAVKDVTGRVVLQTGNKEKVDISRLSAGVYEFVITDEDGIVLMIEKVVKVTTD